MKEVSAVLVRATVFSLLATSVALGQSRASAPIKPAPARSTAHPQRKPAVCSACIRAHEEFLASDAMRGRGSGTHDELVAATYIAAELRAYGIAPAGDEGSYIQSVPLSKTSEQEKNFTWNAVGILQGSDAKLRHEAVLLSAHLDHVGIGRPVNGDSIYNGADDDASGVTAVLELARVLGAGPRPRRTVIFALFGSEETGGLGSTYFREHPPVPLKEIAANLEFEMIGRPDPKVDADTLWLTGWERSNLGPTLAAHGAHLVADPHPSHDFFARSDNYVLAKVGVVAQTVSSYGLHADYHRPSDDIAHLDFKHMEAAIGSMLGPVEWLVNSSFRPAWNEGGRP
jgi:Peptidase family M28